jgi:hypothetical protein
VLRAWTAQEKFERACRARGREILSNLPENVRPIVVMSRPYNGCDKALSLDLPAKLRKLNVLAIPLDFLDFSNDGPSHDRIFEWMYWKNGQRILHAARFVREHPRLHAIYLSSFSCGPDSFLLGVCRYFRGVGASPTTLASATNARRSRPRNRKSEIHAASISPGWAMRRTAWRRDYAPRGSTRRSCRRRMPHPSSWDVVIAKGKNACHASSPLATCCA